MPLYRPQIRFTTQLGPIADASGNLLAPLSAYASIFPAVQNLMLAARAHGRHVAECTERWLAGAKGVS